MRTHFRKFIYVIIVISLSIIGCQSSKDKTEALNTALGIPTGVINSKFVIEAPNGWNTFQIGDSIGLSVDLISEDQISFSFDYGVKIYTYENDNWEQIENLVKYPAGSFVVTPNTLPQNIPGAVVDPIIEEVNKPIKIRIILFGHIYRDGKVTEEITAAAIDIDLQPKYQTGTPQ